MHILVNKRNKMNGNEDNCYLRDGERETIWIQKNKKNSQKNKSNVFHQMPRMNKTLLGGNPAEAMSIIDRICVMFISIAMRGSEQKKHLNRAENLNLNKNSLSSFPKWA